MTGSDVSLRDWLDAVAARTAAPGGGSTAAVMLSAAGALGAMVARFSSRSFGDADALASRADLARRRALELAVADEEAVHALYPGRLDEGDGPDRTHPRGDARGDRGRDAADAAGRAAEVPLELLETAATLAPLLKQLRLHGNPRLAGDAQVALELLDASARGAAALVRIDAQALAARERERVLAHLSAVEARLRDVP